MTNTARTAPSRARVRLRRREVRQCLADAGLAPAALRAWPGRLRPARAAPHAARLRAALEAAGPVFAAFGDYLASGADPATTRLAGRPPPPRPSGPGPAGTTLADDR